MFNAQYAFVDSHVKILKYSLIRYIFALIRYIFDDIKIKESSKYQGLVI